MPPWKQALQNKEDDEFKPEEDEALYSDSASVFEEDKVPPIVIKKSMQIRKPK